MLSVLFYNSTYRNCFPIRTSQELYQLDENLLSKITQQINRLHYEVMVWHGYKGLPYFSIISQEVVDGVITYLTARIECKQEFDGEELFILNLIIYAMRFNWFWRPFWPLKVRDFPNLMIRKNCMVSYAEIIRQRWNGSISQTEVEQRLDALNQK